MKEILKKSFVNVQFIVILILTIIFTILFITSKNDFIGYASILGLFIIILHIIGFFRLIKMNKNIEKINEGTLKYEPYVIDKKTFIEECKNALMYSIIRIDGKLYEISTEPNGNDNNNLEKYICYINNNEIIGIENFLNYKFDGEKTFNDLDKIEFLEINDNDPKKYLIDRII